MGRLHIIDHPLVQDRLTVLRKEDTGSATFRRLTGELSLFLCYELARDLPLEQLPITTPVSPACGSRLSGKAPAVVAILRAGLGMLEGPLSLFPDAAVGHIGLCRDEATHQPVSYYCKLPPHLGERLVILVDPMLATGGSAGDAIRRLKEEGATAICLLCLVAAPEGVKRVQAEHPEVEIYAAALDCGLNEHAYILPGLGDAGDRLFGTEPL